jgi:TMEM70/TMEM186/TMEM223 protein family
MSGTLLYSSVGKRGRFRTMTVVSLVMAGMWSAFTYHYARLLSAIDERILDEQLQDQEREQDDDGEEKELFERNHIAEYAIYAIPLMGFGFVLGVRLYARCYVHSIRIVPSRSKSDARALDICGYEMFGRAGKPRHVQLSAIEVLSPAAQNSSKFDAFRVQGDQFHYLLDPEDGKFENRSLFYRVLRGQAETALQSNSKKSKDPWIK